MMNMPGTVTFIIFAFLFSAFHPKLATSHECANGRCDELLAFSCQDYFETVGREECAAICLLSEDTLCTGFSDEFLTGRRSKSQYASCHNGELLDPEFRWRVKFTEYEDSTSKYFTFDLTGPSEHLGEHASPKWFSEPAERYRFTLTIRPNWKLHYSFDLQMFSSQINRKGFDAINEDGSNDTEDIEPDIFGRLDDEIAQAFNRFFKEREFPECEAVRRVEP